MPPASEERSDGLYRAPFAVPSETAGRPWLLPIPGNDLPKDLLSAADAAVARPRTIRIAGIRDNRLLLGPTIIFFERGALPTRSEATRLTPHRRDRGARAKIQRAERGESHTIGDHTKVGSPIPCFLTPKSWGGRRGSLCRRLFPRRHNRERLKVIERPGGSFGKFGGHPVASVLLRPGFTQDSNAGRCARKSIGRPVHAEKHCALPFDINIRGRASGDSVPMHRAVEQE